MCSGSFPAWLSDTRCRDFGKNGQTMEGVNSDHQHKVSRTSHMGDWRTNGNAHGRRADLYPHLGTHATGCASDSPVKDPVGEAGPKIQSGEDL